MSRTCIINQPAGLGDILFCQKIAYYYHNKGYEIIWPVKDVYLKDVIDNLDTPFYFVPQFPLPKDPIFTHDYVYLPLDGCSTRVGKMVMESKIVLANVPYNKDWTKDVRLNRTSKSLELIDILGLDLTDKYVLTNYNFASPPNSLRQPDRYTGPLKEIELSFIRGFSLFDWQIIMEAAEELFVTDSCVAMLAEILNCQNRLRAKKLINITRQPNFQELSYMYNLPWEFIKGTIQL